MTGQQLLAHLQHMSAAELAAPIKVFVQQDGQCYEIERIWPIVNEQKTAITEIMLEFRWEGGFLSNLLPKKRGPKPKRQPRNVQ